MRQPPRPDSLRKQYWNSVHEHLQITLLNYSTSQCLTQVPRPAVHTDSWSANWELPVRCWQTNSLAGNPDDNMTYLQQTEVDQLPLIHTHTQKATSVPLTFIRVIYWQIMMLRNNTCVGQKTVFLKILYCFTEIAQRIFKYIRWYDISIIANKEFKQYETCNTFMYHHIQEL